MLGRTYLKMLYMFHILLRSHNSSSSLADVGSLRQMIQLKMDEKQRAGPRLISRGAPQSAPAVEHPITGGRELGHHSEPSRVDSKYATSNASGEDLDEGPKQIAAKQNQAQAEYARKLLHMAGPSKAQTVDKYKRKKKSNQEELVRKGFG